MASELQVFIRSRSLRVKPGRIGVVAVNATVEVTVAASNPTGQAEVVTVACKLPHSVKLVKPRRNSLGPLRHLSDGWLTFKEVAVAKGRSNLVHFSFAYLEAGKGQAFVVCSLKRQPPKTNVQAFSQVQTVNVVRKARE
jgi:hypothetical protein